MNNGDLTDVGSEFSGKKHKVRSRILKYKLTSVLV